MTATYEGTPSRAGRILNATPILGPLSRAIAKEISLIYYLMVIALTAEVLAIQTFGIVALAMTALAAVPVMLVMLLLIARP